MSFYSDKIKAANLAGVDESVIIDEMQELVDEWINTNIKWDGFAGTTERVEYYDINKNDQTEIVLKHFPIIALTEIEDDLKVLNVNSYSYDSESGIVHLLNAVPEFINNTAVISYFTRGNKTVKVTYSSGYATVPDIIVKLSSLILAKWSKIKNIQAIGDTENLKNLRIGNYSESYDLNFMNVNSEFDDMINTMVKKAQSYYADGY